MTAVTAQVAAVLASATVAASIAIWGVLTQRAIARRRATMDFLDKSETDEDLIEARKLFIDLALRPEGLAPWAEKEREPSREAEAIRLTLNQFELLATGIRFGIIDFDLCAHFQRTTVLKFWQRAEPFILRIRERVGVAEIYVEFERLKDRMAAVRPSGGRGRPRARRT